MVLTHAAFFVSWGFLEAWKGVEQLLLGIISFKLQIFRSIYWQPSQEALKTACISLKHMAVFYLSNLGVSDVSFFP